MTDVTDVTVSVLGFREGEEWCALALEMDLRGYGHTFALALDDLQDSIAMQISFAFHKGAKDMIFHPAEPVYFSLFAQVREDRIRALAASGPPNGHDDYGAPESEYAVAGMPIPPAKDIARRKDSFSLSHG